MLVRLNPKSSICHFQEAQVKLEKAEEMLLHKMTSTIEAKRRWEEEKNEGGSGGSEKPKP